MQSVTVAPIVEGHGEVSAARILLRRIAAERLGLQADIAHPFRLDSAKMRKSDELSRAIRFQAERVQGTGGVLILRDGDDSDVTCPVALAEELAPAPGEASVRVEVVIACREYEAWFLAALESLRAHSAVQDDAVAPDDPEAFRDAKSRLQGFMTETYKETLHQAKFSALIDLEKAEKRSRSFRRMVHAVQLLSEAR